MRTILCESCYYASIETSQVWKPVWKFSNEVKRVTQLIYYCKKKFRYRKKFVVECDDYKPRVGKIGNKLYQKSMEEFK